MVEGLGKFVRKIVVPGAVLLAFGVGSGAAQEASTQQPLYLYPDASLSGVVTAQLSKSAEECRSICSSRSGCMGFDHVASDNICRLFVSISSAKEAKSGMIAGSRVLIVGFRNPVNLPAAQTPVQPTAPPVAKVQPAPPPKPSATRCIVADPTDTPTNVRDAPNGNILTTLNDGASVVISRIDSDSRGRPWAKVYGDAEGWVFRKFLRCG